MQQSRNMRQTNKKQSRNKGSYSRIAQYVICDCGSRTQIKISNTPDNPRKPFHWCPVCPGFLSWCDDEVDNEVSSRRNEYSNIHDNVDIEERVGVGITQRLRSYNVSEERLERLVLNIIERLERLEAVARLITRILVIVNLAFIAFYLYKTFF